MIYIRTAINNYLREMRNDTKIGEKFFSKFDFSVFHVHRDSRSDGTNWWNGKDITSVYNERFNANEKKNDIYLMDTNVLEVHNIFNSAEFYVFLFPLVLPYLIRSPFFPFST